MTLAGWLERLRMMARSSVVELHPTEVADLVRAIGDAAAAEREACASFVFCALKDGATSVDDVVAAIRARGGR